MCENGDAQIRANMNILRQMKFICVGRNYGEHAKELGNDVPEEPVIFLKPDTALLREGHDFYIPSWSNDIHHEIEFVVRIGRPGKFIEPDFAHTYIDAISVGVDFTARDKQQDLKSKGLPWELAKGFDLSAAVGKMQKFEAQNLENQPFHLLKNKEQVQNGNTAQMIFPVNQIISFVSRYFTLKIGDCIFTGTPAGVGPVKPGDVLQGYLGETELLHIKVK